MIKPKISWWQRMSSYLVEIPLETTSGQFHPSLQVSLVKNRFQLSTENAIYSFDDLYLNFNRAFQQIDLPPDGSSVLLLGLGLGSVPFILEKQYQKQYDITAVEFDEVVINLASMYTLPRLLQKIQIVHADAEIYVKLMENTFDLVIVDLFLDDAIPPYFESISGLEKLKEMLNPGALILINRLYRNASDRQKTKEYYRKVFLPVFKNGSHLDVGGNWIIIGR